MTPDWMCGALTLFAMCGGALLGYLVRHRIAEFQLKAKNDLTIKDPHHIVLRCMACGTNLARLEWDKSVELTFRGPMRAECPVCREKGVGSAPCLGELNQTVVLGDKMGICESKGKTK